MAARKIVDGTFGGDGGEQWSYRGKWDEISTTIYINYDEEAIFSITFVSLNKAGKVERQVFGGGGVYGNKEGKIELDNIMKLNGISGTVDTYQGAQVVTSLRFTTLDNKSYGPFGSMRGDSFSLDGGDDHYVSGLYGQSSFWLDAIGVLLNPILLLPKIGAGPWGSLEANNNQWEFVPKSNGSISHISITHDDCINSIIFTSKDVNGNEDNSKKIGSTTGSKSDEVSIDINNEKLNKIAGTYVFKTNNVIITSLSFSTDKKKVFGPYGIEKGTSFSCEVDNEEFIGFYGLSGSWLDSIGVYLRPKTETIGQWGSQEPGNEWSYAPKGLISEISITHDDAIYSIMFTSEDENGNVEHSEKFGSKTGSKSDKIEIDIKNDEKLIYISGTVGVKNGYKVITSISFRTDPYKVFGPFGVANETAFSLPVSKGYISGFHGRAGFWLDAIGVYVKPIALVGHTETY